MFHLHQRLTQEHCVDRDLDIFRPDFQVLYMLNDEELCLIVQAADHVVNHAAESASFQTLTLYNSLRSELKDLWEI